MWQTPGTIGETKTLFVELIPGENRRWHKNPHPQWIVPLSRKWLVETMDGVCVEMGVGDISFGADQRCRDFDGHEGGHLSGAVGDKPVMLMLIQKLD